MIKAVIFDCDGVLIDMADWHYKALNMALKEVCGYEIDYQTHIKYYNGISTKAKIKTLVNRGIIQNKQQEEFIWELKQKYTEDFIDKFPADETKINLMNELKNNNIRIACASNSIRFSLERMLKNIGVINYMEFYLGNEDFGDKIKPDPHPYNLAIEKLNLNKNEVLIVEDSPKGILSAKRSGAHVFEVSGVEDVTWDNIKKELEIL